MRITALQLPYFLALFLFFVSGISLAQEDEFVRATVIDQSTGEPVIFASVLLKGKARGVIANLDGGFRLPARYRGGYHHSNFLNGVSKIRGARTNIITYIAKYNQSKSWYFKAQ